MVKLDDQRSPVIESGSGKLQLKNEQALIQVRAVISALSSSLSPGLKSALLAWRENEERMNKETKGEYKIAWKKLEALFEGNDSLKKDFQNGCDDYREYADGIEDGTIVPSPTPPPASVIVTREQAGVQTRVAAIYGKRGGGGPRRRLSSGGIKRVKVGNGNSGE